MYRLEDEFLCPYCKELMIFSHPTIPDYVFLCPYGLADPQKLLQYLARPLISEGSLSESSMLIMAHLLRLYQDLEAVLWLLIGLAPELIAYSCEA